VLSKQGDINKTDEFIQERNRLNVLFVANDLQQQVTL